MRRTKQAKDSTLSELFLYDKNGGLEFLCYCLEDKLREVKIIKETAIDSGEYEIKFRRVGRLYAKYQQKYDDVHLTKLHGMLEITGLERFKYVMFHIGNFIRNTYGCPLMGDSYSLSEDGNYAVWNSTKTYKKVYPRIAEYLLHGDSVKLIIENSKNLIIY